MLISLNVYLYMYQSLMTNGENDNLILSILMNYIIVVNFIIGIIGIKRCEIYLNTLLELIINKVLLVNIVVL